MYQLKQNCVTHYIAKTIFNFTTLTSEKQRLSFYLNITSKFSRTPSHTSRTFFISILINEIYSKFHSIYGIVRDTIYRGKKNRATDTVIQPSVSIFKVERSILSKSRCNRRDSRPTIDKSPQHMHLKCHLPSLDW